MAVEIPFNRKIDFDYGRSDQVSPLIRRVIAKNPGPFTFTGTGTYIVGRGNVAVIDPGPDQPEHVQAILDALERGERVSHIVITHTHIDHSPAARPLQSATGAPTWGYGPHGSGPHTSHWTERDGSALEGGDASFNPDHTVRHGDRIAGDGWTLEAVHTPGHTSNHICYALTEEKALFSGDHVMGWSTSVISPPDGDMTAYMHSLRLLLDRDDVRFWPTHGPAIENPQSYVAAFIAHREDREHQITECLERGLTRIPDMVEVMYANVDKALHPAAARSVLAHLVHMVETNRARADGPPSLSARYAPARASS